MAAQIVRFFSLLFVGIEMSLSGGDYLQVQHRRLDGATGALEYSQATAAMFDLIAFIAVVFAVLAAVGHREDTPSARRAAPGATPISRLNARLKAASDS